MTARAAIGTVVAVIAAAVLLPATASAATVTVNTQADHNDKFCDLADCTLREAVELGANTINLPKGHYTLTLGELDLVNDEIDGAGARAAIIDGNNASRVLRVVDGTSTVKGVTVTGGNGVSATSSGSGGGILVQSGAQLNVSGAAIEANTGASGGGINVAGALLMDTSTVSGNSVEGRLTAGGGITTTGTTAIINSTISGNTAAGSTSQGGGIASNGFLGLNGVTISNNTASAAAGLLESIPAASAPNRTILNTIIGGNNGPECAGSGLDTDTTRNSLADDTTCALADATDQQGVNPQLRALANYGGATDTHALLSASPAINKGSGCVPAAGPIDQRGVSRPQAGTACDVGAFEYRPHALTVITNVVNNNGGTLTAAQAQVHVRVDGADAKGSPAAGVSGGGRAYSLLTGNAYVVAADAVTGYGLSYSAGCSAVLAEGGATTCTVTVDDIAPTLKVVTVVQNDSGGNAVAADFSAHVRQGGRDVSGSPQAGSGTGTTYTLSSGNFSVSAEGVPGYSATGAGGCAADGSVTLALR